ncbi:MAG: lactate racemase domain-containing protein [Myxococcota bacterium]
MAASPSPRSHAKHASIRFGAWYDDRDLALAFPENWTVEACPPADGPDIGEAGIDRAFDAPIGGPRLRALARGRRSACIVIDDLSRPTPGDRLVPRVLAELNAAGIEDRDVLVLAGVANHRPMTRPDFEKKLGRAVLERCAVANHFSWDGCRAIGRTRFGSPVELNADFLDAEVKILVGSIIPHGAAGFSGGSKLVFPGVASLASAEAYHRGTCTRGRYAEIETDARLEADEAARLAGVDFLVNSIPSSRLGIAGLVTGDVVAAHRAGCEIARRVYSSPTPAGADVCVLSVYPKDAEFLQYLTAFAPWQTAPEPLVREGGSVVVALDGSEGLGSHWLFGPGMRLDGGRAPRVKRRELAFFAPGIDRGALQPAARDATRLFKTWEETLAWLVARHGARARVSVFPCGTIQLGAGRR